MLDVLVYVAVIGAPVLAIYSVWRRLKKSDPDTAGYIYNGKKWVTWLLLICLLAVLFISFIMPLPIISEHRPYRPEWGGLLLGLYAVILYICYNLIAYIPATAEELEESKVAGNTVMGTVGETTASMFSVILGMIGGVLAALPGMIGEALNPTLAIKTIGNTVYKVVGTGVTHAIIGIVILGFAAILIFVVIMFAAYVFALLGTFAIGIIAIAKFVINNFILPKKKQADNA